MKIDKFEDLGKASHEKVKEVSHKVEEVTHKVGEVTTKVHDTVSEQAKILTRREVIKYIISCILLGSLTFTSRQASVGTLQMTFLRVMIGTFFLMTVFCVSTRRATLLDYSKSQLVFLIVSGICIGLSYMIIADAVSRLGPTTTTLIYAIGPGLLLITAPLLFKDTHYTPTKIAGFLICSLGVYLLDPTFFTTPHGFREIFDVLVAAVFTVVIVYCNRKLETINGLENAMFQLFIAFLIIAVVFTVRHGFYFEIPYPASVWTVVAGILNTGLPVYLYLSSIDDLRPDTIAFVGYVRPLTTVLIATFVFKESLTKNTLLGMALILGGVGVANFFRRHKLRKNRTF